MERLEQRRANLEKALDTLEISLDLWKKLKHDDVYFKPMQDSVIQRFEYSLDTFWKFLKQYIETCNSGEVPASPRAVVKMAFDNDIITLDQHTIFVAMLFDRNMTSHTYNEELANGICKAIPTYYTTMRSVLDIIDRLRL